MAATAGYGAGVYVTTSSSTPSASDFLNGGDNVGWEEVFAFLTTNSYDSAGEQTGIGGVRSINCPVEVVYSNGDTAQGRLISANQGRTSVYIHHYPLGRTVAGRKAQFLVNGFKLDPPVDGVVRATFTVSSIGAPAAASTF